MKLTQSQTNNRWRHNKIVAFYSCNEFSIKSQRKSKKVSLKLEKRIKKIKSSIKNLIELTNGHALSDNGNARLFTRTFSLEKILQRDAIICFPKLLRFNFFVLHSLCLRRYRFSFTLTFHNQKLSSFPRVSRLSLERPRLIIYIARLNNEKHTNLSRIWEIFLLTRALTLSESNTMRNFCIYL